MIRLASVLTLLVLFAALVPLAQARRSCTVESRSGVYACDTFANLSGETAQRPVPKAWFAAHCARVPHASPPAATCDEVYVGPAAFAGDEARPRRSAVKAHLRAVGAGAVALGVLAICALGNGCGFMGGGSP
jgi:hypothetical protein